MLHLLRSSGTLNKLAQVLIFALLTTSMVLIPAESEQAQANTSYGYNSTVDYAATVSDGAFVSGANEAVIPASDNTFTVDGWFYLRPGTSDGDDYQTLFAQNQDTGGCRAGRLFVSAHWTGSQYDLHAAQNSCGDFFSLGVIPTNTWLIPDLLETQILKESCANARIEVACKFLPQEFISKLFSVGKWCALHVIPYLLQPENVMSNVWREN